MLIGILSDIHDNVANLKSAQQLFSSRGIDTLIFCGDFCSPIPVREMAGFKGVVHCVFGNGDGDRHTMAKIAASTSQNVILHGEWAELTILESAVAVTHYPFYARALARTGDYQAVFSGHTHEIHEERIGGCLWLNPGEIMGWKGPATCAVYDVRSNTSEILTLE